MIDFLMGIICDYILPAIIIGCIFLGIPIFIYALIQESHTKTFLLSKDKWDCSLLVKEDVRRFVGVAGKGGHYVTRTEEVCVQYTQRGLSEN